MTVRPIVKILPFSSVDGPGNRSVVFVAGCNFACLACHNPHTINRCDQCGVCAAACPNGALTPEYDPSRCLGCDRCRSACPKSSTPKARLLSPQDVMSQLSTARPFTSGLTISGGEPTLQPDFSAELLAMAQGDGLHTLIDSNGSAPAPIWRRLLPHADGVALDIKVFDPDLHRLLTGQDLKPTLASAVLLAEAGKLYEVRHLVIPGYTGTPELVSALAAWLVRNAPGVPLSLLAFRSHGVRGRLSETPSPTAAFLEELAAVAREAGVTDVRIRGLLRD